MKLELLVKYRSTWKLEDTKHILNHEERLKAINRHLQQDAELKNILVEHGFQERGWNKMVFGSKEFFDLLNIAKDYIPLQFLLFVKLSKKEEAEIKVFSMHPNSVLPIKYDIYNHKYFDLIDKQFPEKSLVNGLWCIKERNECIIVNKYNKWKDKYFKCTEYDGCKLIVTNFIKELIEANNMNGFSFSNVKYFIEKNKDIKEIKDVYGIKPMNTMKDSFLKTKFMKEKYNENHHCKYYSNDGNFVFSGGSLDNIDDLIRLNTPTGCCSTDWIVSSKFKTFYDQHKLKGLRFEPIFETQTEMFDLYNEMIANFAKELQQYNTQHCIGHEEIDSSMLVNGVL